MFEIPHQLLWNIFSLRRSVYYLPQGIQILYSPQEMFGKKRHTPPKYPTSEDICSWQSKGFC